MRCNSGFTAWFNAGSLQEHHPRTPTAPSPTLFSPKTPDRHPSPSINRLGAAEQRYRSECEVDVSDQLAINLTMTTPRPGSIRVGSPSFGGRRCRLWSFHTRRHQWQQSGHCRAQRPRPCYILWVMAPTAIHASLHQQRPDRQPRAAPSASRSASIRCSSSRLKPYGPKATPSASPAGYQYTGDHSNARLYNNFPKQPVAGLCRLWSGLQQSRYSMARGPAAGDLHRLLRLPPASSMAGRVVAICPAHSGLRRLTKC